MPYIISFAMQRLHNTYTEEYQWFYYMLNAILTMQLWWVLWEKSLLNKEVVRVIMVLLIPLSKLFHCEIVVCCPFCCLKEIGQDTSISLLKYVGLGAGLMVYSSLCKEKFLSYILNMFVCVAVHVSLIFSSSKYYWANVKVPRQQDRYQTDFIVSHGNHEWNVMRSNVLLSRSHSQYKWDVLFFHNNRSTNLARLLDHKDSISEILLIYFANL